MVSIQESDSGITFAIKVHPAPGKTPISGLTGDAIKVSLTAPPAEGKPTALASNLRKSFHARSLQLKVPRSSVTIASGHASRDKEIRVAGMSLKKLRKRIPL